MRSMRIAKGVTCVEISEAGLSLLCGCPENVVKHLMKAGIIHPLEKDGVRYESGPNAILLSECSILGGRFANAAEFPVLQMLYRQGMIVPGHPGNTGRKPMLIGLREQIEAQSRYIYLGNYGLSTIEAMEAAGLPRELAEERLRMKLAFAFGKIRETEELLDLKVVDARAVELRDGVFVRRLGPNRYSIIHGGEAVTVDLDDGLESLQAPYDLPSRPAPRRDFSVVQLGEGDGWDVERPCMGSLIMHDGEPWLVDAGPDIEASLEAVGLGIGDLRGVFHTHVHDDHFIGLASLFRAPRRLRYCAVPWVRAAAAAKLAALAGIGESEFCRYFDVRDLVEGQWNDVDGLEVLPVFSPHPVETTIIRFRAYGHSYAHWADLSSFRVLDGMRISGPGANGLPASVIERVKADYLEPADLKKVDIGGGMIHGDAKDFSQDRSKDLLLSHTDSVGAVNESFGRVALFGEESLFKGLSPGSAAKIVHPVPGKAIAAFRAAALFTASFPEDCQWRLAQAATELSLADGSDLVLGLERGLVVMESGRVEIQTSGELFSLIGPGDLFGEERILYEEGSFFRAKARGPVVLYFVPAAVVEEMPALLWRLKELHENRLAAARACFRFAWRPEYAVGVTEIDMAHQRIFAGVAALSDAYSKGADFAGIEDSFLRVRTLVMDHYDDEEIRMATAGFPGYAEHARLHASIIAAVDSQADLARRGEADIAAIIDLAKDDLLEHSLLVDRQYIPWLLGKR